MREVPLDSEPLECRERAAMSGRSADEGRSVETLIPEGLSRPALYVVRAVSE